MNDRVGVQEGIRLGQVRPGSPGAPLEQAAPLTPVSVAEFRSGLRGINMRVRSGEVFKITNRNRPVAVYGPVSWMGVSLPFGDDVTLMDVRGRVAWVLGQAGGETPLRVMEYGQCIGVLCPYPIWQTGAFSHLDKESTVNDQQSSHPSQQGAGDAASPLSPMKVLAVWNEAGGATKTTLVAELGYVLSQRLNAAGQPNRVLLIDLDPQRSLTRRMGFLDPVEGNPRAERLASTLFMAMQDPEGDIPAPLVPHILSEFRVYPANTQMRSLDATLVNDDSMIGNLRLVLQRVSSEYDYVLIDTPPSNGGLTRAALVAADYAVIPVPAQIKGIENIENVSVVLGQCRRYNPDLQIACFVPTTYNSQRKQDREVLARLKDDFSRMAVVTSVITDRPAIFRNVVPGYTTVGYDTPRHESTTELNVVLSELLSAIQGAGAGQQQDGPDPQTVSAPAVKVTQDAVVKLAGVRVAP